MTDGSDLERSQITGPALLVASPPELTLPNPCVCLDAKLATALEAVATLEGADLEAVLVIAEASRPGVRNALRAAFEAEAHRYAHLARSAFAAADRLIANPVASSALEGTCVAKPFTEQKENGASDLLSICPADPAVTSPGCIATLNDAFRRSFTGGRVVLSAGVAALPSVARAALLAAVRGFDCFDADDDPHGEHDFGAVTVAGYRCLWKIDTYDLSLRCSSPDPTDPAVTIRVLTIMLAEEY